VIIIPTLQEIRRITQELRFLEEAHFDLDCELSNIIQKGQGPNFKIIWVYDKDEVYPTANLYIVCCENEEFIRSIEFGLTIDGIFTDYDEIKYYNEDGTLVQTSDEVYVTMMDFARWGKGAKEKVKNQDVQRTIPVRIKSKVINILSEEFK